MADRARNNPQIIFHLNCKITEILGTDKVSGVKITDTVSGETGELACQAVFAALGHIPCNEVFKNAGVAVDAQGYFIAKNNTSLTDVPGVFVAGDCADPHYRQAITAAGTGARAAIDAEKYLAGH